jgi:hypothetical protein
VLATHPSADRGELAATLRAMRSLVAECRPPVAWAAFRFSANRGE